MNSIQPNMQTPPPQAQASQLKAGNGAADAAAPPQGFAAAMDNASAKAPKKATSTKSANGDAGGKQLPAVGNSAPPAVAVAPNVIPVQPSSSVEPGSTGANAKAISAIVAQSTQVVAAPAPTPAVGGIDTTTTATALQAADASTTLGGADAGTTAGSNVDDAQAGVVPKGAASTDGVQTGTVQTGTVQADAVQTGTVQTGAVQTDAVQAGAVQAGAVQTDAAQAGAVQTGAVQTDAAPALQLAPGLGSAAHAGTAQDAAAQIHAVRAGAVSSGAVTGTAQTAAAQAGTIGKAVLVATPSAGAAANDRVAAAKSNVVGLDGTAPATDTSTAQSALSAVTASDAAGSIQTGADAGDAAMAATTSGVATQNSISSADSVATAATGTPIGADAATIADATASATAAVAASASRVITELASTTATDKRSRGADPLSGAASMMGANDAAGAAQGLSGTSSASNTDATVTPTFKVGAGVESGEFGQGVANQVATMVGSNISSAKLSVNPPALGPIEVRIDVQGDHAQVLMTSHSAVTRDALQASTPKLREMLTSQGFGQVSVDISQRSFQERTPTAQTYEWNSGAGRNEHVAAATAVSSVTRAAAGMLDAYA
jgi:flagellar hook-length control protein FliK